MRVTLQNSRDPQGQRPLLTCSLCGGELYRGEEYWRINGFTLCSRCLLPFARMDYAPCRRICGEEVGL